MNINELIQKYIQKGYEEVDSIAKVCQDIILIKLDKSKFKNNITIKGGVVMHSISNDKRRATRDIDIDFIKYSLDDKYIKNFIDMLNETEDGINISIVNDITKLHHQDYDGKRVYIKLTDKYGNNINSKLDIGVHKEFDIIQDEYCFNLDIIDRSANLLINSKEQIFVEKLKSLLKFGIRSTRYKDIFDFYYLINNKDLNKSKLMKYIDILIFKDELCDENSIEEVINRINLILNNKRYKSMLSAADNNWLDIPVDKVIINILSYLETFKNLEIHN